MSQRNYIIIFFLLIGSINVFGLLKKTDKSVYIEGYDRLKFSVEKITVSPGATVEITLKTISDLPASQMAHNWVLLKNNTDVEEFINKGQKHKNNDYIDPELEGQVLADTGMLAGGEENTITFTAPQEKGTYMYVCTFPGHYIAGMKGKFIVQ